MSTTRKKIIKTVYNDEDNLNSETEKTGDFSDSGSDAYITEYSSSEDEEEYSSEEDFKKLSKNKRRPNKKAKFAKSFNSKVRQQMHVNSDTDEVNITPTVFTVKDLSENDKLLPPILNLSESDSSDDDAPKVESKKEHPTTTTSVSNEDVDTKNENDMEYRDVWSNNIQDNSEKMATKTFLELQQHKAKIDAAKASIQNYSSKIEKEIESDVKDLLAQGEEIIPQQKPVKKRAKKRKVDSDSEMEDWEEVKESKTVPQQGIQLFVEFPDTACRRTKTLDVEMMMKRKINRVKKEYQVYMHKVHVLCWLGYGNNVSSVLNNQDILSAALSMVPSKECYPGERVDMKYVEQITNWYKDKLTLEQDKNENKFRPKAPPLKDILLSQIKRRVVTTKKYMVFIFVSMLRALGLQCRIMLNFKTLPIKPPSSELCSLSTKPKNEKNEDNQKPKMTSKKNTTKDKNASTKNLNSSKNKSSEKLMQVDGNDDSVSYFDNYVENIMQVDGNNDGAIAKNKRTNKAIKNKAPIDEDKNEGASPPKRSKKSPKQKSAKSRSETKCNNQPEKNMAPPKRNRNSPNPKSRKDATGTIINSDKNLRASQNRNKMVNTQTPDMNIEDYQKNSQDSRQTRSRNINNMQENHVMGSNELSNKNRNGKLISVHADTEKGNCNIKLNPPKIVVTQENEDVSSNFFKNEKPTASFKKYTLSRKRSQTNTVIDLAPQNANGKDNENKLTKTKPRTKSVPGNTVQQRSKYFNENNCEDVAKPSTSRQTRRSANKTDMEDNARISHKDLVTKTKTLRPKNDVTEDLMYIVKKRVREAKECDKKGIIKGKMKNQSDDDSDYLPEEIPKDRKPDSDNEFKPKKITPKPKISPTVRRIDRRVLSSDEETSKNKVDVWCEVFVEELEQWIAVDVVKGKIHCTSEIYSHATHPITYIVGWDNNNYLKDLTRKYVPHWNTVTRKQRVEPAWWGTAIRPWLGPKTARDKEEDVLLDRMQLEAPLPKSIAEYKNHPLYALKRHLLKFEAIYPPDAPTLGFIRGEPVYARECVYICRSRDTWLKEAKVVKLGEKPYKVVKARPKWDKLSNKLITDKPLEVYGPWQVQDYEPPEAENGIVPRNAYGNVELFKDCMLPKGTVHIKLPGLNKVARKLNIDCAPAMTGFEFNGGWSHPVYDGFVVCKEYEEIITEAWIKDQEEQEKREREKIDARVYGNWRRLIKGLLIRERLKIKYGFEQPGPSQNKKKGKGPRVLVKRNNF